MKSTGKFFLGICIIAVFTVQQSCGFYSFSGTSICAEVETYSVSFFENNASIVSPLLSQTMTEELKQKFISETNLSIQEKDGDYEFSGSITKFEVTPVAAQNTDVASQNRLTIVVSAKLVCEKCPESSFEKDFNGFLDFDATEDFSSVENQLVGDIVKDQLVQKIFNEAAINW